jgi:uncharacterized protein
LVGFLEIQACLEGVIEVLGPEVAGAKIDLLLAWPNGSLWAIEVKRSLAPKLERGFHAACADLKPERRVAVYPGTERYPMGSGVEALPLPTLMEELVALQ